MTNFARNNLLYLTNVNNGAYSFLSFSTKHKKYGFLEYLFVLHTWTSEPESGLHQLNAAFL